jgi:ankyrin repeat protein
MNFDGDTPRTDVFGTPRDDRFSTPRMAQSQSNSSDNEWHSPRAGPTSSDGEYGTPRDAKEIAPGLAFRPHENSIDEDDEALIGMAEGISEQDVEDIFSYARHERCGDIERLLDRGIPINVRDEYGNTLLTIACQNGSKRVAKIVLRRGADINARNYRGNTPLHYCYHYGYGDSLGQYLMSKGADASIRNNSGRSCFDGI